VTNNNETKEKKSLEWFGQKTRNALMQSDCIFLDLVDKCATTIELKKHLAIIFATHYLRASFNYCDDLNETADLTSRIYHAATSDSEVHIDKLWDALRSEIFNDKL
jgi:hypothetical protein